VARVVPSSVFRAQVLVGCGRVSRLRRAAKARFAGPEGSTQAPLAGPGPDPRSGGRPRQERWSFDRTQRTTAVHVKVSPFGARLRTVGDGTGAGGPERRPRGHPPGGEAASSIAAIASPVHTGGGENSRSWQGPPDAYSGGPSPCLRRDVASATVDRLPQAAGNGAPDVTEHSPRDACANAAAARNHSPRAHARRVRCDSGADDRPVLQGGRRVGLLEDPVAYHRDVGPEGPVAAHRESRRIA